MRALVLTGQAEVALMDRPALTETPDHVVAAVLAAGICGSEIEAYRGLSTSRVPPLVMGHEASVRWGDRSWVVNPLSSCGECAPCLRGDVNLCPDRELLSLHHDGAHADEVLVPRSALVLLPDDVDPVVACLVEPLATAINALSAANGQIANRVAVIGCGTLGLLAVRAAIALGARTVVAADPHDGRRELAARSGAQVDQTLPPDAEFDLVIDMVGAAVTRVMAIERCAPGGTVKLCGLHSSFSELPISRVISLGLRLEGTYAYRPEQFQLALELLAAGRVNVDDLITVRTLAEGADAFAQLSTPSDLVKVVLVP